MITPELRKQREEEEALKDIVRRGLDMRLNGAWSVHESTRYWLGHLPNLPIEIVAEVLAYHLPTTQRIEHALMKDLLKRRDYN